MGPILLFDKSTLQSLSVDEAVWLDQFFLANITPLFFVETLADIEKATDGDRTPEDVVRNLAEKTPTNGAPNVHHDTLCFNELLYARVIEMEGRIIVSGGRPFSDGERRGVLIEESPEVWALRRWREGRFLQIERAVAKAWRHVLAATDLDVAAAQGNAIIKRIGRPRDLAGAKAIAEAVLAKPGSRDILEALSAFPWPESDRREAVKRWRDRNLPIRALAPYTAHVLTVDLFFSIALAAGLIGRERPSNKVDLAYLYYLPFCHVFTSKDALHRRTASLFMTGPQIFVWGEELKADLSRLDTHYDALPDDVKERGIFAFASYPPAEGDFLVSSLWDKVMRPEWRQHATQVREPMDAEAEKQLVADSERMVQVARATTAEAPFSTDEADVMITEHNMPVRRGKWRTVPPEVEHAGHDADPAA